MRQISVFAGAEEESKERVVRSTKKKSGEPSIREQVLLDGQDRFEIIPDPEMDRVIEEFKGSFGESEKGDLHSTPHVVIRLQLINVYSKRGSADLVERKAFVTETNPCERKSFVGGDRTVFELDGTMKGMAKMLLAKHRYYTEAIYDEDGVWDWGVHCTHGVKPEHYRYFMDGLAVTKLKEIGFSLERFYEKWCRVKIKYPVSEGHIYFAELWEKTDGLKDEAYKVVSELDEAVRLKFGLDLQYSYKSDEERERLKKKNVFVGLEPNEIAGKLAEARAYKALLDTKFNKLRNLLWDERFRGIKTPEEVLSILK